RRFETQNEAGGGCNDNIRLCAHHVAAELGIAVLSSLARISRHHQIFSLDIPKPAQLFEQCGIIWMVPGFVHFGDGDRGVNNCDVVCLRRLLRARRDRPRRRSAAECGQQFPPSDGDCHTPSRARCVKPTIARLQRAVFTFKEGRMLVASTQPSASTTPAASSWRTLPWQPRASTRSRASAGGLHGNQKPVAPIYWRS